MATATFTVILGSLGRPTLVHLLDSIKRQERVHGDQCIVAIDSYQQGERQDVQDLVHSYGEGFIACAYDAGYHWLGVEQINYAMRTIPITGTHILTIGDDDVFVDSAYASIRPYCSKDLLRPVMYRVLSPKALTEPYYRELLPVQMERGRGPFEQYRIGGSSIAAPWPLVEPMTVEKTIHHDYMWLSDIVKRAERLPLWLDYCVVIARAEPRGNDVTHQGILHCWFCGAWDFMEDVEPTRTYCKCGLPFDKFSFRVKVAQ